MLRGVSLMSLFSQGNKVKDLEDIKISSYMNKIKGKLLASVRQ